MSESRRANDWKSSKHLCPPNLLKDTAFALARKCGRLGDDKPFDTVERARALEAWLAKPFAEADGAPFRRAVQALELVIEDHRALLYRRPAADLLKLADEWLAALEEWATT